jgi:tryptophan-rich sensory protein
MIAVSFYLILKAHTKNKTFILGLFLSNFVLNAIWTLFYFRMQNPLLAFIDILLLICSTTLLVFYNYKINKTASYLLIPYLLWLGFAGILNFLSI